MGAVRRWPLAIARASCRAAAGLPAFPTQMRDQQCQRRRCDAVDAAGMADGARPMGFQLVPHLVRKSGQRRIVDIVGQDRLSSRRYELHVGGLAPR